MLTGKAKLKDMLILCQALIFREGQSTMGDECNPVHLRWNSVFGSARHPKKDEDIVKLYMKI